MEEEIIRITINEMLEEIKPTDVDNFEGLCYFCSNNLMYDLLQQEIKADMLNIRDYTGVDYDHYFLIAGDNEYLIDLTYSQFLPNGGEVRFFEDFPASVLSSSEDGKDILNHLLSDYYIKLTDDSLKLYLNSFKPAAKRR